MQFREDDGMTRAERLILSSRCAGQQTHTYAWHDAEMCAELLRLSDGHSDASGDMLFWGDDWRVLVIAPDECPELTDAEVYAECAPGRHDDE